VVTITLKGDQLSVVVVTMVELLHKHWPQINNEVCRRDWRQTSFPVRCTSSLQIPAEDFLCDRIFVKSKLYTGRRTSTEINITEVSLIIFSLYTSMTELSGTFLLLPILAATNLSSKRNAGRTWFQVSLQQMRRGYGYPWRQDGAAAAKQLFPHENFQREGSASYKFVVKICYR